jgi:hypothetical protein
MRRLHAHHSRADCHCRHKWVGFLFSQNKMCAATARVKCLFWAKHCNGLKLIELLALVDWSEYVDNLCIGRETKDK